MIVQPIAQEQHHVDRKPLVARIERLLERLRLRGQLVVLLPVLFMPRIAVFPEKPLFGVEMVRRVVDQLRKYLPENVLPFADAHGIVQRVDELDEFLMLPVHFLDMDSIPAVPFNESHSGPPVIMQRWNNYTRPRWPRTRRRRAPSARIRPR